MNQKKVTDLTDRELLVLMSDAGIRRNQLESEMQQLISYMKVLGSELERRAEEERKAKSETKE